MATVDTIGGFMHVDPPVLEPVPGITQYVETIDVTDPHELMGVVYEGAPVHQGSLVVPGTDDQHSATKTFDGLEWVESTLFTAYLGVSQALRDSDDFETKAKERYVFDENRLVEAELWNNEFPLAAVAHGGDLNAAGAVSLATGLGLLEEYIGSHYGAAGIIHWGKILNPTAASHFETSKGPGITKITPGGNLLVDGRGYIAKTGPAGLAAGTGNVWIYATGHIVLRRGEIETYPALNAPINTKVALAERQYVVTIDPIAAAVRVKLE